MDQGIKDWKLPPPGSAKILDYIFLLRPMILIPVWTFFLLGAWHSDPSGIVQAGRGRLAAGIFSFSALIGAIYIINQIADRESDRANEKLFLVSHAIIGIRAAWVEAVILVLASAFSGLFLPAGFLLILAASLALGLAYSLGPVRLKGRPVLDTLANALGNGILNTLAGWIAAGGDPTSWKVLIPYPLAVASVHLATTLADIEGDRASGLKTSGVLLGRRRGMAVSALLMGGCSVAAFLSGNRPALYASLLSFPFFAASPYLRGGNMSGGRSILIPAIAATAIFSLTAGFFFPVYIPVLAAVVLLTRIYYSRRFGISYPSL